MNLIVVTSVWLGCLAPYLASNRQKLSQYQPAKTLAWIAFFALQGFSIWALQIHSGLASAALTTLAMLMCMWILLVLSAPYVGNRILVLSAFVLLPFCLISFTGSAHVT